MNPLTKRQAQVLGYIRAHIALHGCAPTHAEIARKLGVSKTTAFGHVLELERKGQLVRGGRGSARGLQLVDTVDTAALIETLQDCARWLEVLSDTEGPLSSWEQTQGSACAQRAREAAAREQGK